MQLTGLIRKASKGQVNSKESAIGMNWIKEMMELQDQADDAKEFVDSVKENYLAEEIYVFTPDGAVRSLPKIPDRLTLPTKSIQSRGKSNWCQGQWPYGSTDNQAQDRGSGRNCHQSELLWAEPRLAQYGQDQQGP